MKKYDTMDALTGLFERLKGGSLVAVSAGKIQGTVRLIIENRSRLAAIPDSWGRVVVTLTDCRRFAFRSDDFGYGADFMDMADRLRPLLRSASRREQVCEVVCSSGLMHGTLEMSAAGFTLMLGGGRTPGYDEFIGELEMSEGAAYSKAS